MLFRSERELLTLGIDDLRAEPGSILLIEWGEKFPQIANESNGEIAIERIGDTERRIVWR